MIPAEIDLPEPVTAAEHVAERRGSRIWRVSLADGSDLAVKYATDNPSVEGAQATARLLAAREAAVLAHLDQSGYLYASGETDRGTWIAVAWIDAPTLGQRWRGMRAAHTADDRRAAATATVSAAGVLADLHRDGWRHGDVQPDHILIPDTGEARLIDLALAQGPVDVAPHVAYRGGIAHLTAPEIAAELLATPAEHHVTLSSAAEVYTFGAAVATAWTRRWPHDYGTDPRSTPLEDIYRCVAGQRGRRRVPDDWPDMAAVLHAATAPDPRNRPSVAELHTRLMSPLDALA